MAIATKENTNTRSLRAIYCALLIVGILFGFGGCKSNKILAEKAENGTSNTQLKVVTVKTFQNAHLTWTDEVQKQSVVGTFKLPDDPSNVKHIAMFVKLRCPEEGCGPWDVFANIKVKDTSTGEWYEMARWITPYGVDNHKMPGPGGYKYDVTDFKSLLTGTTKLRLFTETWKKGWLISVKFKYTFGDPKYKYSSIARIIGYADNTHSGVPYGVDHAAFDLKKTIHIPENAAVTYLRTIITGWGMTNPDNCAEFCFRTHHIMINGENRFKQEMGPLGCKDIPIQPQSGTWWFNRAGWCPGMPVKVRINKFDKSMAGKTFTYKYSLEPWTRQDPKNKAFYNISSFVVVKSNQPINKPIVTN